VISHALGLAWTECMCTHSMPRLVITLTLCLCVTACCGCRPSARVIYLNRLDSPDNVSRQTGVTLDTTSWGRTTIRIDATGPTTVRLADVRPDGVDGGTLIYRGHLRASELRGRAYFEIQCTIVGKGGVSSKGLKDAVSGTTDWTRQATPIAIEGAHNVESVRLNVVVEGAGAVWVDNIALTRVEPR
jgi:hypothetical protein